MFRGSVERNSPLFEPEYTVYYKDTIVYFTAREFTVWDGDNDINHPSQAFFTNHNSCVTFLAKLVDALNDDPRFADRLATMTPSVLISMFGLPSIPCPQPRFVANKCVIYDDGAPLIEFRRGSYSVGALQTDAVVLSASANKWSLTYACDIPLTAGECIRNLNIAGLVNALNASPSLAIRLASMATDEMTSIAASHQAWE